MTIFSEIREASSLVVERSRWVRVVEEDVNLYPERLGLGGLADLNHTKEHHLLGKGDDTLRYFLLLDTVNFGSGYFPFLNKDEGVSGYFTVARRLKEHVEAFGIPTASHLSNFDAQDCANVFQQELYNKHMEELMELFALAWREFGAWVLDRYDGDYLGVLSDAKSADDVVRSLSGLSCYSDVSNYFGTQVPFYKRAQILIQDMKIAEPRSALLEFDDLNELTVFADNVLPYVFAEDGLIDLDPWLAKRIDNEELIGSGSPEEIELRACSVYIGERLAEIIREEYRPISVRELDFFIWSRGQKLKKISQRKRHRTRCTYY